MDEMIYNALTKYYHALSRLGYMSYNHLQKLLILIFIRDFVYKDFRGLISECDYHCIERALDCIYGSTCLIPYPDYLKMGNLYLGEISEMAQRLQNIEDANMVKVINSLKDIENPDSDSDIMVVEEP